MIKNLIVRFISLFYIFLLISIKLFPQHAVIVGNKYRIQYEKHSGILILRTGEVIKGVFQYAYWEFPTPNFIYFSDSGKLLMRYKTSLLESASFEGSDTTLSKKDSTYFKRIGKSSIYRQLTFGEIKIYDPLINVNERPGLVYSDLIVLENNKPKIFHSENDIVHYIVNKLKEKGVNNSFNSIQEAISYLNSDL